MSESSTYLASLGGKGSKHAKVEGSRPEVKLSFFLSFLSFPYWIVFCSGVGVKVMCNGIM